MLSLYEVGGSCDDVYEDRHAPIRKLHKVKSLKTAPSCVHTHQSHNVVFNVDTSVL